MAGTNKTDEYGQLAESFWQLDHKMAPKNIYHYCISESSKSIIENNSLWASAFECMNDNKEFRHGMALAKSEVEKTFQHCLQIKPRRCKRVGVILLIEKLAIHS